MKKHCLGVAVVAFACIPGVAAAQTTPPRFTLVEELRIDGAAEDLSGTAYNLWVSPDGRVAFFNAPATQWVFFGRDGKRTGAFGAKGEGPGEFNSSLRPNLVSLDAGSLGDTMWVYSGEQRRFTLVGPDRKLVRTLPLPARDSSMLSFSPRALLAGNRILGSATFGPRERGVRVLDATCDTLIVMAANGTIERRIAARPVDSASARTRRPSGASVAVRIPFAELSHLFVSPTGDRIGTLSTTITSPTGGTFRLSVYRATGETVFSRTYPYTGEPVTKRMVDSAFARLATIYTAATPGNTEMLQMARARVPAVDEAFRSSVLTPDGSVWVVREARAPQPREVMLFSPTGDVVGTVRLPRRSMEIQYATRTNAWATEIDSDGFVSIVRFRVEPAR